MKSQKSIISTAFKELEKYGFIVRNLQTNERLRKGMADLPDIIVIGKRFFGDIYFVEVKIGADKLSKGQKVMKEYLECSGNYFIADETNYKAIIDEILNCGWQR